MKVIKNNQFFDFNKNKIRNAIIQAYNQIDYPNFEIIDDIVNNIEEELVNWNEDEVPIEEVENLVMSYLYRYIPKVAREYSSYKINRERIHTNPNEIEKVLYGNDEVNHENANKNPDLVHIKNAYLAEIPSKEIMLDLLPPECKDAHLRNVVYFHDAAYSAREMINCCLYNLEELFKGCQINGVYIEAPKSFQTACTVASQALSHATSCQYGLT